VTFDELLAQVQELLRQEKRVSYRGLKRRFALDDEYLEDLKEELIGAKQLATDEDGRFLVWAGNRSLESSVQSLESERQGRTPTVRTLDPRRQTLDGTAERRQLTVMFCDLVGSTALSEQLDPEEYREVVHAYQQASAGVIDRFDGHIAQYLGDGLLVYFGYPAAHEDDAQRAVRAGLEIIQALRKQVPAPLVGEALFSPTPFQGEGRGEGRVSPSSSHPPHPSLLPLGEKGLQVRIGIHTGPVVVGEMGSGSRQEQLALGETPNLAARIQGTATPDTVVISAATSRLIAGFFTWRSLGPQTLKGISTPVEVYQVLGESGAQSRFDVAVQAGLTPLVGREEELALLRRRWEQATEGEGQVVLLSGEPGIGKSRLVQELKDRVAHDSAIRIEFRCSPYHQNSALYPLIEHVQQVLHFAPSDTPQAKVQKLEQTLAHYRFPQRDTVPLLAALLSLPHPEAASLTLAPQQQKQKTLNVLLHWLFEEAERAPVYSVWEDLHWVDPSTLEFLALCLDQVPTARMLMLLTFRPEFTPTWTARSHVSHLVLSRLGRKQTSTIVEQLSGGKALPSEVLQQIVAKTDGVPLFIEELTKTVLESVESRESIESEGKLVHSSLRLGIPTTLQDALMARLDRLGTAKEVAQQGSVVGRELTYELLSTISSLTEVALQQELTKLVEAELLYQRGLPPQATYLFKHALVQETAYQSLLKSKRQQYHHQIAQVFEAGFPETKETRPELVAHHYTEAGLIVQAIPYWQRAGERATQRSAHGEAISHLTKGLELLKALLDTPEHARQELTLQIALGPVLMATKGYGAPEVGRAYARARELCRRMGDTPQLFSVLAGLHTFYQQRGELQVARELGEQCLSLAQRQHNPTRLLASHLLLGMTRFFLGELVLAREQLERGSALYDPQRHRSYTRRGDYDQGMGCLSYAAWVLWLLGYPDQALERGHAALTLARGLAHPVSLAFALNYAATLHQFCREGRATQEQAEEAIILSTEGRFLAYRVTGTILRSWALAEQENREQGVAQIRQGLAAWQATGAEILRPFYLALLAEACGKVGQIEEGLGVLAEALAVVDKTGECWWEAELYRLKGELTLQKFQVPSSKFQVENPQSAFRNPQSEAEACFLKAIDTARKQQAKSLELRATMSLAKLWQQQGKQKKAHEMLAEIYGWFTEGLDTADLQEAKTLLDTLLTT
jgi:class 3 adenylate cyclase/predicted ATPase